MEIYTDGSRNNEIRIAGTGMAIYLNGLKICSKSYQIGDRPAVCGENYGIKKAALFLLDYSNRAILKNAEVVIYSAPLLKK